ncbi:MAG TPA: hypothetical protein VEU07_12800 [Candidatus Acidoferrum sp.]|nr:hypothetical protein [Candidatus Acidoferrum sp.]
MISGAVWILSVHLLAMALWLGGDAALLGAILPAVGKEASVAVVRRAHFLTSRAMEILFITGVLNILFRGMASQMAFSPGFYAMLAVKMALLFGMAGLQIWMGLTWKRPDVDIAAAARKARIGVSLQLLFGAVAVLLGMGLRMA